jgi:hypothetical protein
VKRALAVAALPVLAAAIAFACADDPHRRTSREQALGASGFCNAEPGQLPLPDCGNPEPQCVSIPGCSIDEARCGSKSTCLPIGDNKGKTVKDFRMRRLNIAAPAALAGDFIQNTIVNLNIDLDAKECAEPGKGMFTWLLRVDTANNTLVTGGSPPANDPFGMGFCFARFNLNGTPVEPFTVPIELEDRTFRSLEKRDVNIPIFLTKELSSAILLPLSKVRIEGVKVSEDGNCIGRFDDIALDSSCFEDRKACPKWKTNGALAGFITLENADKVLIKELNFKSLCAFIVGVPELVCPRDGAGKITKPGDYCSTDEQPGSCRDSVWLAATFAASAAKVFDGAGVEPGCSGARAGDAGTGDGG